MSWDFNDIETPESEAVQAEREIVEEIVRNERPAVTPSSDNFADQLDDIARQRAADVRTARALDEGIAREDTVVRFKRLRNGAWGITGPSALLAPDSLVAVTKRDGSSTTVRVNRVLWSGDGKAICTTRRA